MNHKISNLPYQEAGMPPFVEHQWWRPENDKHGNSKYTYTVDWIELTFPYQQQTKAVAIEWPKHCHRR